MPQKKKQFRFKIPWLSRSRAPTQRQKSPPPPLPPIPIPTTKDEGEGIPRAESQQHPRSRSPAQSPTSSVVFKSPLSSPSQSPTQPSTPTHFSSPLSSPSRKAQTKDESTDPAAPSASEQENGKTNSPLKATTTSPESETSPSAPSSPISKAQVPSRSHHENGPEPSKVTPHELELETQVKTHQADDAKETVVMEHEAITKAVKGNANDVKHGESTQRSKTSAPASSGVVQTKDASARAFREDHRKQKEARQSVERKTMILATSSSSTGRDLKVVSPLSDPSSRIVTSTSISPDNPPEPNGKEYHIPLQKGIKDEISNFVKKVATVTPTQPMDDKNFSVVTLAGESKGATMHVGSSSAKKEGSIYIYRAYKTDPEENTEVGTDSDQENSSRSSAEKDYEAEKAYVNSNIQCVNNSLMLHGSVSERDPGVRVVLPQQQQQQAEPIKKPLETRRPEVNINRAEKTGYQPVIRRRCLRGMFLEPIDDELDNPDKPRRHGCKVRCGDKGSEIM